MSHRVHQSSNFEMEAIFFDDLFPIACTSLVRLKDILVSLDENDEINVGEKVRVDQQNFTFVHKNV